MPEAPLIPTTIRRTVIAYAPWPHAANARRLGSSGQTLGRSLGQKLVGVVDADVVHRLRQAAVLRHERLRRRPLVLAGVTRTVLLRIGGFKQVRGRLELLDLHLGLDAGRDLGQGR